MRLAIRDFLRSILGRAAAASLTMLASGSVLAARDAQTPARPRLASPGLYAQACALCHGADGKGSSTWQGEVPVPDFTDCLTNTAEPVEQWETIIARGGKARGLSSVMPAFGEALDPAEIRDLVVYLRAFCRDFEAYPPGDLNFRRPLETGKAYPEQEIVLKPEVARLEGATGSAMEISYENRLGPGFQYEVTLPVVFDTPATPSRAGVGDLEIEGKQVLSFDPQRLQILSAGLGMTLPTGDRDRGLGEGAWAFSPFFAYGKAWDRTFLQTRAGAELSTNADRLPSQLFFELALSQALGPPRSAWVPAFELVGSLDLHTHEDDWGVLLEVSQPLTRLGHVIASIGVRLPLTQSAEKYRIEAYLLWDFGDGPFWKGW